MSDLAVSQAASTRLWDTFGKTDPSATKAFSRSGGFKGTAVKPMWCNKRMTEVFGPAGLGWGSTQPVFQVVPANNEIMVYCTVGLWYKEGQERSDVIYGVGGDKVLVSQSSGLKTSDEAFKMAYTDALGNAMKFIGMAADIHMGLFDDSKYVDELKKEFSEEPKREVPRKSSTITRAQAEQIVEAAKANGWDDASLRGALKFRKHGKMSEIPVADFNIWMGWAKKTEEFSEAE